MMSGSIEKSVYRAIEYGLGFAEAGCPTSTWNEQEIDTSQLALIAKAVFGVTTVTIEVCTRYWHIGGRSNA